MTWLSVNLSLRSAKVEEFTDLLLELGGTAVNIDAAKESVSVLFPSGTEIGPLLSAAAYSSGVEPASRYSVSEIGDHDWLRFAQDQFPPLAITPALYVVPTWSSLAPEGATVLRLDPGLAFGTGSHATTRLCLRWLASTVRGGETVLDYGCGSGILAIAAMKLGAARAVGVDNDKTALETSRANASLNEVDAAFWLPEECPRVSSDIIVANILLKPLIELAPRLTASCHGLLALSGVLESDFDDLNRAYGKSFDIRLEESDEGWALFTGRRR